MRAHVRAAHLTMRKLSAAIHNTFQSHRPVACRCACSLLMLGPWLLTAAYPAAAQLVSVTT